MGERRRHSPALVGSVLLCVSAAAAAQGLHPPLTRSVQELVLLKALQDFGAGDVQAALNDVSALVAAEPNFRLAQLVYGDLLASRTGKPLSLEAGFEFPRTSVEPLLDEARQRLRREGFHPDGKVPAPLLKIAGPQAHIVLVDTSQSRLYLFENRAGQVELIADFYVSAGKNGTRKQREGDRRTPLGVYFVTSRLPGDELPDKYGPVAFPVDYPNVWDQRLGRTGNGIWLHGVASNTYSRPPLDSDGCVAMSNEDLDSIASLLEVNTPVIIGDEIEWLPQGELLARREQAERLIEGWRTDWESGDTEQYLANYSTDFQGRGMNYAQWMDYKRRVNAGKKFIQVDVSDLSIFSYPDESDLLVVSFRQEYESDNVRRRASKRQYWRHDEDGRWRIVSEEAG